MDQYLEQLKNMTIEELQSECKSELNRQIESLYALWEGSHRIGYLADIAGFLAKSGQTAHNILLTEMLNWQAASARSYPKKVVDGLRILSRAG